ncbi:MAG: hypothetical protein HQL23_01970 [Candidatus Omnitrophica bacterium]|nr:hypothetical protein [Candidatus Omnitrophota bacterium]
MDTLESKKLLRNRAVLDEIARHQWIESEKAGKDIGFDNAAADWLERFSKDWMNYHLPKRTSCLSKFFKISK